MKTSQRAQTGGVKSGFTLVEMMVVLSIVALLGALAAPLVISSVKGPQLTSAEQIVRDQISMARQTALTSNQTVEVRFYQYALPNTSETSPGKYRALQTFQINDSGPVQPLSKIQYLPNTMIIDSGSQLSPLINSSSAKVWNPPNDPQIQIPNVGLNYNCVAFQFRPDGSVTSTSLGTNLNNWFLTVHNLTDGDNPSKLPLNFATLQIDPVNGNIRLLRP